MKTATFPALQPRVVLGIAAHPDDLDFTAGGAVAAFARQGATVYYLVLTDGSQGSDDRTMTPGRLRDLRREEQRQAGKILGVQDIFFLDYPDGALEVTQELKRDIVKVIRQLKPELIISLDPTLVYSSASGLINHPDHRAAGQAVLDAVYPLARDHMAFPQLLHAGLEPHKTPHLLLARFEAAQTNFGLDITDTMEQKLQALAAHASQFPEKEAVSAQLRQLAAEAGEQYGGRYAEAFVRLDID